MLAPVTMGRRPQRETVNVRRLTITLASIALLVISSGSSPAASAASGSEPVTIVRDYIVALDHHDAAATCRLFSVELRALLIRTAPPPMARPSCRSVIASHFHSYYSNHRWASATIRHIGPTAFGPASTIAVVHLTLAHRYVCTGRAAPGQPCHPGIIGRPDIIYLIQHAGRWRILKPGLVLFATESDQPAAAESTFYPPGDPSTVTNTARIPGPQFACPPAKRAITDPANDVTNTSSYAVVQAPWLDITRLGISQADSHTVCFSLTLAAPPRADSSYAIYITHEVPGPGGIEQSTSFAVEVDGLGVPHALLAGLGELGTPGIARYLPQFGLDGEQLDIAAAIPSTLLSGGGLLVSSQTTSLQADEPLLPHPLNASDTAPNRGCLRFPAGGISTAGICGQA